MTLRLPAEILEWLKEQQRERGGSYASLIINILRDAMKANHNK